MSLEHEKNQLGGEHPFPNLKMLGGLSTDTLFSQLLHGMYAVSIMVWDAEGTIICCNDVAARGFQQPEIKDLIGKSLFDFAPESWAKERYQVAKLAIESGQRITFLEILGGFRLRTLLRPVSTQIEGQKHNYVLVTVEPITSKEYGYASSTRTNEMVIHANFNDLGKLDVLTNRELEVLALMGQGLRAKDIAKQLCRSVSTIDNHRDNIGEKLDVHDRGELIAMAKCAALQVEDASRQRVQFSKHIPTNSG
jgi:DNA-binding CsgD family transcriptional regulator